MIDDAHMLVQCPHCVSKVKTHRLRRHIWRIHINPENTRKVIELIRKKPNVNAAEIWGILKIDGEEVEDILASLDRKRLFPIPNNYFIETCWQEKIEARKSAQKNKREFSEENLDSSELSLTLEKIKWIISSSKAYQPKYIPKKPKILLKTEYEREMERVLDRNEMKRKLGKWPGPLIHGTSYEDS